MNRSTWPPMASRRGYCDQQKVATIQGIPKPFFTKYDGFLVLTIHSGTYISKSGDFVLMMTGPIILYYIYPLCSNKGFGGKLRLQYYSGGSSTYNTLYLKFHGEVRLILLLVLLLH